MNQYWNPGYWQPVSRAPRANYVYVRGWWDDEVYIDGYYRPEGRTDGQWEWVEGYYLDDGTYVRGHWRPLQAAPQGYLWEPGFWDGETYVDGFWRPEYRPDFTWVSSYYDTDGVFHAGYWMPYDDQVGFVWVPGWFDGNQWVDGYWVRHNEYVSEDVQDWQPQTGWNDGWEVGAGWGDGEVMNNHSSGEYVYEEDLPLALPVVVP